MARRSTTVPHHASGGGPAETHRPHITLPMVGRVTLPPPEHLAFYAVLGVLGALEIVDWPVVLVVGAGHLLAEQRHSRVLREAGEAAEAA